MHKTVLLISGNFITYSKLLQTQNCFGNPVFWISETQNPDPQRGISQIVTACVELCCYLYLAKFSIPIDRLGKSDMRLIEEQSGFRQNKSTFSHLFTVRTITDKSNEMQSNLVIHLWTFESF